VQVSLVPEIAGSKAPGRPLVGDVLDELEVLADDVADAQVSRSLLDGRGRSFGLGFRRY